MFNMLSRKRNSANQKTPTASLFSIDYDGKKDNGLVNLPTNTGWEMTWKNYVDGECFCEISSS